MSLNCGIVGLPNVGKSTIFRALTSAPAEAANYPFCTIEPNVGIVQVPDERLNKISQLITPQKIIPSIVEFVDIAGLVAGASKGEGLGNQFLGHIRQVGAIIQVVRCFDDDDIIHVAGKVDPVSDVEVINLELALADLETVQKRIDNLPKLIKSHDKKISSRAKMSQPLLERVKTHLEKGEPVRSLDFTNEEIELIHDLHLITQKKMLYVCNVDEATLENDNKHVENIKKLANNQGALVIKICGQLEAELAALENETDKNEFLSSMGLEESGLAQLIRAAYQILGLRTYFTAGEKEVRAWTFAEGATAPQAAGIIHSDFERGFIKAEIYHCDDLFKYHSEAKVKEAGRFRIEGKEYKVKDGDIIHFRFNV